MITEHIQSVGRWSVIMHPISPCKRSQSRPEMKSHMEREEWRMTSRQTPIPVQLVNTRIYLDLIYTSRHSERRLGVQNGSENQSFSSPSFFFTYSLHALSRLWKIIESVSFSRTKKVMSCILVYAAAFACRVRACWMDSWAMGSVVTSGRCSDWDAKIELFQTDPLPSSYFLKSPKSMLRLSAFAFVHKSSALHLTILNHAARSKAREGQFVAFQSPLKNGLEDGNYSKAQILLASFPLPQSHLLQRTTREKIRPYVVTKNASLKTCSSVAFQTLLDFSPQWSKQHVWFASETQSENRLTSWSET